MKSRIMMSCVVVIAMLGLLAGTASAQMTVTDGLQLWLDASVGVSLDENYVMGWADQSGNGNDAYANFGYEPTYTSVDPNLNNQPSLDFDGANAILNFSTQVMPDDFSEMTIFSVAKSDKAGNTGIFTIRTGGSNPLTQLDVQTNGSIRYILRDTSSNTLNAGGSASCVGQYGIFNGVLDLSDDGLTQTAIARFGGGAGYAASGTALTSNMAAADYYVGGWGGGKWDGTIAELLVYDRALTEVEQNNVASYLSSKYGVGWEPLEEPVVPLLDERYNAVVPENWETFVTGTGISDMFLDGNWRHAQWTLPDPEQPASETNSASGIAFAAYTAEATETSEWENTSAISYIRIGGDAVGDTTAGLAVRVQDEDMETGASGSFYGIAINLSTLEETGSISLIRQTGGVMGTTDVLATSALPLVLPEDPENPESPTYNYASTTLVTKLEVSTTEDGKVQIDGLVALDEAMTNTLAVLSFLDDSEDKLLGPGGVGYFGVNAGDIATAANWSNLTVYETDGAITPIEPDIAGDANGDGKVDGSDVTILAGNWQKGVNDGLTATWEEGDFNGDGKVDGSDVTILAGNWQYGVTAAAASVPEPSTIALLLMGIGSLLMWKRVR